MKYPDLFNPDLSRIGRRESQMYNVIAGRLVAEMLRSSLGPRGMEKIYIDILEEATITKYGGAFLRKLDVDHPAAKSVIEAVNTVDTHVGDGTISASVLISALLKKAEELLKRGIPTSTIIRGYEKSMEYALDTLDGIQIKSDFKDRKLMRQLVDSCLEGKAIFDTLSENSKITDIFIEAVCCITDFKNAKMDVDDIKIEEKFGNSTDIQLIKGTVIDKSIDNTAMPHTIENAKILLLNEELETMRTKTESEIEISSPGQMSAFLNQENHNVLSLVKKIIDSGVNVVISRKGISELAQEYLAKSGIISIRRVKYNDLWWLEKATGAKTCKNVEHISREEIGFARKVYERSVGGDKMIFVEDSINPKSVTILLRANSKRYLDEFHRTAKNAIFVLRNFIENPFVLYGGGSSEAVIANKIRKKSIGLEDKEQLVVSKFADSMEEIPLTLACNVGMNPIDTLPQLRSKYVNPSKHRWYGINSKTRTVAEMSSTGIIETSVVKQQIIRTAVETTNMILNVDDVFMKDLIDNTHCHIDGTVHAHKDPGRNHNHWEQEGIEQRQMHHYY